MSAKTSETTRYGLVAVVGADIGIAMILIGTLGLGPASTLFRDIVGWILIAHAAAAALQAIRGRVHRVGVQLLGSNAAFVGFAAYQILATSSAQRPAVTAGLTALVLAADIALVLFWACLSGRQLDRQLSKARHVQTTRG